MLKRADGVKLRRQTILPERASGLKIRGVQARIEGSVLGFGPWAHGEDVARAVGAFGAAGRCARGGAEARRGRAARRRRLGLEMAATE